jgi:hypothetical protein
LAQYAANDHSQVNNCASTNVSLGNAQAYSMTFQNFCTTPCSLPESYSCQSNTPYMLPTISYCNGVSDLRRHESMEGQLDRASSKDSLSSNASIDLVLEKQMELIAGLVIEDVFVLPSKFLAKSTSNQIVGEGENEQSVTIDYFVPNRSSNVTDPKESCNTVVHADAEFSGDSSNDQVQSAINKGWLKLAKNPQMKLNEVLLQININTVDLEGKKVMVRPS